MGIEEESETTLTAEMEETHAPEVAARTDIVSQSSRDSPEIDQTPDPLLTAVSIMAPLLYKNMSAPAALVPATVVVVDRIVLVVIEGVAVVPEVP